MSKFYKTIIFLGVVLVLGGGIWLYVTYQNITEEVFTKKKGEIVLYIQIHAADLLKPSDFDAQDSMAQDLVFSNFFETIQSLELFRIKVFNRNPVIIWSNLKEIIGQNVADNEDVQNALSEGIAVMHFKSNKSEQMSERQFKEFTETYIPIQNKKGEYVGVVEVYQTNIFANQEINKIFRELLISAILFGLFGYAVIVFLLWFYMARNKFSCK